jgi:hypothetical protein
MSDNRGNHSLVFSNLASANTLLACCKAFLKINHFPPLSDRSVIPVRLYVFQHGAMNQHRGPKLGRPPVDYFDILLSIFRRG